MTENRKSSTLDAAGRVITVDFRRFNFVILQCFYVALLSLITACVDLSSKSIVKKENELTELVFHVHHAGNLRHYKMS
jgi:hypothetical protein